MDVPLPKFSVELIVRGATRNSDPEAVEDIASELSMRPHLSNCRVSWEDGNRNEIIVYMESEGLEPNSVGDQMAEELFEVACATLRNTDGISIKIGKVNRLQA